MLHHLAPMPKTSRLETYSENGWIIGHRWLWGIVLFRTFFNPEVFDIATTKHNVFVDIIRSLNLIIRPPTLCPKRDDLLERDS